MPWMHITVRTVGPHAPLCDPEHAPWLWAHLRECFPRALGGVLMPNHPHVLAHVDDEARDRAALARILGHFARRVGVRRGLFEPIPPFEIVEGRQKLWRNVRYIPLNPCRAGLCDDPLRWLWSTARDVVGAIVDPWVTGDQLARELGISARDIVDTFHRYTSSDPSVAVAGTPVPVAAVGHSLPFVGVPDIVSAAAAATRSPPDAIRQRGPTRRLFVALAHHQGIRDSTGLAEHCRVDARSIRRTLASPEPELLRAGTLCLGDERLRHPLPRLAT